MHSLLFCLKKKKNALQNPWKEECAADQHQNTCWLPFPTHLQQPLGGLQAKVQCIANVINLLLMQAIEEVHTRVEMAG